jgi:hypothetical protein
VLFICIEFVFSFSPLGFPFILIYPFLVLLSIVFSFLFTCSEGVFDPLADQRLFFVTSF